MLEEQIQSNDRKRFLSAHNLSKLEHIKDSFIDITKLLFVHIIGLQ
jgi:hypothetical protein